MVLKRNWKLGIIISMACATLLLSFNNCAPSNHQTIDMESSQRAQTCEEDLVNYYKKTVYAYVNKNSNCASCHNDAGQSPYKFASENIDRAFSYFNQVGIAHMSTNAVNPTHGASCPGAATPGGTCTGGAHQEPFNTLQFFWENREAFTQVCNSKKYVLPGYSLATKVGQSMYYSRGTTETLTWNLNLPADQSQDSVKLIPLTITAGVRVNYDSNNVPIGYQLVNLRASAQVGESEFLIEGVYMFVAQQLMAELTDMTTINRVVRGIDPVDLISQTQNINLDNISNFDQISFYIKSITVRARTDNPPTPPNPNLTIAGGATSVNDANPVAISITNDSTARRWCLTTSTQTPTSNNCPGQQEVLNTVGGWRIARPTQVSFADFGAVAEGNLRIYVWVVNSDLKVNASASFDDIAVDRTPPTASGLAASPSADSQIANATFTNSGDVAAWCLKSFPSTEQNPNVNNNDACWTTLRPSLVGLSSTGTNKVALFVRDAANNRPNTPVVVNANNAFGRVAFTNPLSQLGGANRSVFYNRCYSCHSNSTTVNAKMVLNFADATTTNTSYQGAFALRSSINSIFGLDTPYGAAPAAHQGYSISAHDRIMLWLWKTNTTGNTAGYSE